MNNIDRIFTKDIEEFSRLYFGYLKRVFDEVNTAEIRRFVEVVLDCRESGNTIFFMGNGGSAATASHFANDLAFGINEYEKPFKVMSITDNVPVLTALGNDYGYEDVFVRQLMVYGRPGDVLVGISASGNSPNLLHAFDYALSVGITTIALTAFDGGRMKDIAEHNIHIPTGEKEYGPAEDVHMILDHLVGAYLMRYIKQ